MSFCFTIQTRTRISLIPFSSSSITLLYIFLPSRTSQATRKRFPRKAALLRLSTLSLPNTSFRKVGRIPTRKTSKPTGLFLGRSRPRKPLYPFSLFLDEKVLGTTTTPIIGTGLPIILLTFWSFLVPLSPLSIRYRFSSPLILQWI